MAIRFVIGHAAYPEGSINSQYIAKSRTDAYKELRRRFVKRNDARVVIKKAAEGSHMTMRGGINGNDVVELRVMDIWIAE